jgi:hypothetical protein
MQWEYLTTTIIWDRPGATPDELYREWQDMLDHNGLAGWEFVTIFSIPMAVTVRSISFLIFKRPKYLEE